MQCSTIPEGIQNVALGGFTETTYLRSLLQARLKADGYWQDYNRLRSLLKSGGVPVKVAWKVATYPFPPKDGSDPEYLADPMYAEIAADWNNGKFKNVSLPEFQRFPNGTICLSKTVEPTPEQLAEVEAVAKAPKKWADDWEQLALSARGREANDTDVVRWVVDNAGFSLKNIDRETVPNARAVWMLKHVSNASNLNDFIKLYLAKFIPACANAERQVGMVDDGGSLELLEDYMASIEPEDESEELSDVSDEELETEES